MSGCFRALPLLWLVLLAAPLRAADGQPVVPEQYKPQWAIGQKWLVETVGQQSQARRAPDAKRPSRPLRWQFEVLALEEIDGRDCFKVRVKCQGEGNQPETTLWVDQLAMTLRQVQAQLPGLDGFQTVTETYRSDSGQPFPALAPLTVPPLDLPVFLSGTKGKESFRYQASSGPGGVKAAGEIDFAFPVEQEIARPEEADVRELLPEDYTKDLVRKPPIEVRLKAPSRSVRQLWQPGLPWPVYSTNGVAKARLITGSEPPEAEKP